MHCALARGSFTSLGGGIVRRLFASVCAAAFAGAALAVLLAGWLSPCLGAARWEKCAEGTQSDPATFALKLCHLGVCDLYLTTGQRLVRLAAVVTLILGVTASAAYFSRAQRGVAAGAAVA